MSRRLLAVGVVLVSTVSLVSLFAGCGSAGSEAEVQEENSAPAKTASPEIEQQSAKAPSSVEYQLVNDEIDDMPIKTQVVRHVVVSRETPVEEMRGFLLEQRDLVAAMRRFQHHESPTHIGVYAYESVDKARAGSGQWLGMLLQLPGKQPEITLRDNILGTPAHVARERFGYSEAERQKIYREIVACEDRGTLDAIEREPSDLDRQMALEQSLWDKYKDELADRRGLTRAQLDSLSAEGIQ